MNRYLAGTLSAIALVAASLPGQASARNVVPLSFDAPVKLTVDKYFGGYEPAVIVDGFGNIVVTAHKQNHGLALSPDSRATTKVRSMSWLWTSTDGKTFSDLPGLTPLMEQNLQFGDEGDLATDDAHHIYFVDTNVKDDTVSRWTANGSGKISLDMSRPVGPFGEPVNDRPWVTAHGNGVVAYFGNEGDKGSYPAGTISPNQRGNGVGAGRYTVYMSHDGGTTFDPLGVTLKDSGWCRPAADHRAGSKRIIALCGNDGGASAVDQQNGNIPNRIGNLYAFVSEDDGATWGRFDVGHYNAADPWATWPSVNIAKDGTIVASYLDHSSVGACSFATSQTFGCDNLVKDSALHVYVSKTGGRTWQVSTAFTGGLSRYSWSNVAADGTIGVAYYWRAKTGDDWQLYAGTAKPGQRFSKVQVSRSTIAGRTFGSPLGDFFTCAFGPDNRLNVVWTSLNADVLASGLNSDIFFARQV